MSLYKKLALAFIGPMIIGIFIISFIIMGERSSQYLEEQLAIENLNDANGTALHLNKLNLDGIELETYLSAMANQGVYLRIRLLSPDPLAPPLFDWSNPGTISNYPSILKTWFPIESAPGQAMLQPGWTQQGLLEVQRHDDVAYDELWKTAQNMFWALLASVALAGLIGSLLLQRILAPLKGVVIQAKAIGERRFITTPEPSTTEFAEVTRAMNELARRVGEMLQKESQRLSRQREATEIDAGTGLLLRSPFMARLGAKLESEDADASGSVALVRLSNLARLNQNFGRQTMDAVLAEIGSSITRLNLSQSDWVAGRLNGSDFCLLAPLANEPKQAAEALQRIIWEVLANFEMTETPLPSACVTYTSGQTIGHVMAALDGALVVSDEQEESEVIVANLTSGSAIPIREQASLWHSQLLTAIEEQQLVIATFPVVTPDGQLIHHEGMLRINVDGQLRSAGEFMPWVHRLNLSYEIDQIATGLAIEKIRETGQSTCANLTSAALLDGRFSTWLELFLKNHTENANKLNLEIGEATAFAQPDNFKRLISVAHAAGVKIGIEHMGYRISDIGKLGDLGMDYIKMDSLFSRDINNSPGNAALMRTYINIAQSLGLPCIAEGINSADALSAVFELGVSGACGQGVQYE
ncbi:MAG: EAL domain-containing protein [Luminiphilus sp.]|nr:EAL domain-containing protein [Luminiphilus sp.]MDG2493689.1 EAL domain-containing protein [Luminiphilus sp.]